MEAVTQAVNNELRSSGNRVTNTALEDPRNTPGDIQFIDYMKPGTGLPINTYAPSVINPTTGKPDFNYFVEQQSLPVKTAVQLGEILYPDSVIAGMTKSATDLKQEAATNTAVHNAVQGSYDVFGQINPLVGVDVATRTALGFSPIEIGADLAADAKIGLSAFWYELTTGKRL